ncbi:transposase [Deinococcus peraridilitoris]|uniref:transposase n=1 Tax=Deinococcus peraridilitoris TaxID=432329 RepID=UPI0012FB36F2
MALLLSTFPELAELCRLTRTLVRALLERTPELLGSWRDEVEQSGLKSLQAFVDGLRYEWSALVAACSTSWSNGPTEGVANRLKLVKRQMFGRGSFELLRKKVLLAA